MELLFLLFVLFVYFFSPLIGVLLFALALGWLYSSSLTAAAASLAASFNILIVLARTAPAAWRASIGEEHELRVPATGEEYELIEVPAIVEEYETLEPSRGFLHTAVVSSVHTLAGPQGSFQREYAALVIPCVTVLFVSMLSCGVRLFGAEVWVGELWQQRKLEVFRVIAVVVGVVLIEDALAMTEFGLRALSLFMVWRALLGTGCLGLGARAPKAWAISTGFEMATALTLVVSPRLHTVTVNVSAWPSIAFGCGIALAVLSFDGLCVISFGVAAHQLIRRHLLMPVISLLRTILLHEKTKRVLQQVFRLLRETDRMRESMVKAVLRICIDYFLRPGVQALSTACTKLHSWVLQPCGLWLASLLKASKTFFINWLSQPCWRGTVCAYKVLVNVLETSASLLTKWVMQPCWRGMVRTYPVLVNVLETSTSLLTEWVLQPCWRGMACAYKVLVLGMETTSSLFTEWVLQPLKKMAQEAAMVCVRCGNWIVSQARPLKDVFVSCLNEFCLLVKQAWDMILLHVLRPLLARAHSLLNELIFRTRKPVLLSIEPVLMLLGCVHFAHSSISAPSAAAAAPFCLATAALTSVTVIVIGRSVPRAPRVIRYLGRALTLAGFWAYISLDLWLVKAAHVLLTTAYTISTRFFSMIASVVAVMRRAIWRFLSEKIWPIINAVLVTVGRVASSAIEAIWNQPAIAAALAVGVLGAAYLGHRSGTAELLWLSAWRYGHTIYATLSTLKHRVVAEVSIAASAIVAFWDMVGTQEKLTATRYAVSHMDSLLTSANSLAMFKLESFAWLTYAVVLGSTFPVRLSLLSGMNPEPLYSQAEICGRAAVKFLLIPPIVIGWLDHLLPGFLGGIFRLCLPVLSRAWLGVAFCVAIWEYSYRQSQARSGSHILNDIRVALPAQSSGQKRSSPSRAERIIAEAKAKPPLRLFDNENICAICMDLLQTRTARSSTSACVDSPDENVVALACGHIFHEECLLQWFIRCGREELRCPVCRQNPSAVATRVFC